MSTICAAVKYSEHNSLDNEDYKAILHCTLNPRTNRDTYNSRMTPILALMCFTEGCPCPVKQPFVNAAGKEVPRSSAMGSMLPVLSTSAMRAINKSTVSCYISPAEETYICLVLSKYLLYYLERASVDLDEFRKQTTVVVDQQVSAPLIVEPWRGSKADSVDQKDLDFFFTRRPIVDKAYAEDCKEKDLSLRWLYLDFTQTIASNMGMSTMQSSDALVGQENTDPEAASPDDGQQDRAAKIPGYAMYEGAFSLPV